MSLRTTKSLPALAAALVLSALSGRLGADGVAFRVKDINTEHAVPTGWICTWLAQYERRYGAVAALPGSILFLASDGGTGCELWATRGEPESTYLVRDLVLGGWPGAGFLLGVAGDLAYLDATTPEAGRQVWRSDGSAAGTIRLTDLDAGDDWSRDVGPFYTLGPFGLFFLKDRVRGVELWASDGSAAGTLRVATISPAHGLSEFDPWYEGGVVAGEHLYFTTDEGRRLWRTEGTPEGTDIVHDFGGTGGSGPHYLAEVRGLIYLSWRGELWSSDGTASGTRRVASFPAWVENLAATEDLLFFTVEGDLWALAETAEPGRLLARFQFAGRPAPLGSRVVFFADDDAHGFEPWASDGTAVGTVPLGDLMPGPYASCEDECEFVVAGELAYFKARISQGEYSLWATDGTPAGTRSLAGLIPGASPESVRALAAVDERLVVNATTLEENDELFVLDESAMRARQVTRIGRRVTGTSVARLNDLDGALVFVARQWSDWGPQDGPWRSDGTEAGTVPIEPTGFPRDFEDPVLLPGGLLVARSSCDDCGDLLWATDGVTRWEIGWFWYHCQHHVCGIRSNLRRIGDEVYFEWWNKKAGWELWSSDGTVGGTGLAIDLVPGSDSSTPGKLAGFFDATVFIANDGVHGFEPWLTDGALESTRLLADLEPGAESGGFRGVWPLEEIPGSFFFLREGDVPYPQLDHLELWFYPLSSPLALRPGAVEPVRVGPDFDEWTFLPMGVVGGRFLFVTSAANPYRRNEDFELWASDGTPEGTGLVRDIFPGPGSSQASRAVSLGDRIVFAACEPRAGCEPWVSDGTAEGTGPLGDLARGWPSSSPGSFSVIDDRVLFAACDETHGCEPWVTDGTPAGTHRLDDIAPGPASALYATPPDLGSYPEEWEPVFVRSSDLVYFTADDGSGAELWAMPAEALLAGTDKGDSAGWRPGAKGLSE